MSSVAIQGNAAGAGVFTVAAPNSGSSYTLTMPTRTGTLGTEGPAFIAYASAIQSITTAVYTKVAVDTETSDTNSCYDTTNYRFTPTVAGYYQVNASLRMGATASTIIQATGVIYKNGSAAVFFGTDNVAAATFTANIVRSGSTLIYLNGSTDYIELWAQIQATSPTVNGSTATNTTSFSASLVRGA
jgi:hypothetical protein